MLLIAHLVSGGKINFRTIILISLVSFLSLYTFDLYNRNPKRYTFSELNLAIETLVRRLFYVNYLNIERVANIYELSLLGQVIGGTSKAYWELECSLMEQPQCCQVLPIIKIIL